MFEWKDDYETGVSFIDEQHRKLIEIGDNAYKLFYNALYVDKYDRIMDLIEELKKYAIFHFHSEEEYLLKSGFKGFLSHKVEHDEFIKKFNDIDYTCIDRGQDEYIKETIQFLYTWIDEHILIKDKQHSHK